jgi:hypothetical protein
MLALSLDFAGGPSAPPINEGCKGYSCACFKKRALGNAMCMLVLPNQRENAFLEVKSI